MTEQEIEHVARAMCKAHGRDPNDTVGGDPVWWAFSYDAVIFLAGYHAMQEWQ